jgi:DNA-binding NtrC family response regulator
MLHVLVADDDPVARECLDVFLAQRGHGVVTVENGGQAILAAERSRFDLVLLDIEMPVVDGRTAFRRLRAKRPELPIVFITGSASIEDAVDLLRDEAFDFVGKPVNFQRLERIVSAVDDRKRIRSAIPVRDTGSASPIPGLVGRSDTVVRLRDRLERISRSNGAVLITGESGTGKDLVARAIHSLSRRTGQFVAVNCAAIPEGLFEAELFGCEKGAFTGAIRSRDGRLKTANRGTLFLDEIGELPTSVQAKLLRALEGFAFEPVGGTEPVRVDLKIVSATNRDLAQECARGRFREDLLYRLRLFALHLPPLRERRDDIPVLIEHFLAQMPTPIQCTPSAWTALCTYHFPGNVRELRHAIEHAHAFARDGLIRVADLPHELRGGGDDIGDPGDADVTTLAKALTTFEDRYLASALAMTNGNRTAAAKLLGITRKTLWEKTTRRRQTPTRSKSRA